MKFDKKYTVGVREIGLSNKITNIGILGFLEDIASLHSAMVGYGVDDINTKNKVWILMDWKLKVLKRPKYGDNLNIKTWARPLAKSRFYSYRDFEVFNEENILVAIATSKWVLFDLEKNKISKLEDELLALYNPSGEHVFEDEELEKINTFTDSKTNFKYQVRRTDIDVNKHMHNLNYLSLAYEVLPEEIYEKPELSNVRIMYKHQIKLGDTVNCSYNYVDNKHIIEIKSDDSKILHAIIEIS